MSCFVQEKIIRTHLTPYFFARDCSSARDMESRPWMLALTQARGGSVWRREQVERRRLLLSGIQDRNVVGARKGAVGARCSRSKSDCKRALGVHHDVTATMPKFRLRHNQFVVMP